ncbi:ABC transporter substrate-binding protein [Paenibacillus sp. PR3]|uniref:ABC transporter substrate-binding protein n=1 Tax=Paenibacillus terricola TaxID=2763503 RepID=A0ABR8MYN7_9BACL|nr:ABC transporter substrate-binding protein [Paenibacillus terricola]MBD3921062.1 ABC transporter substrate-binding protein [Paenibacillus terricola]
MKKVVALLTLSTMLVVAGCGSSGKEEANGTSGSGGKVEISMSIWGEKEIWEKALAEFESTHPNIKTKLVYIPDAYEDKLMTMIAGGTAPDMMTLYETTTPDLAKQGVIQDLTPFIEKDTSFDLNDFYDNTLELAKLDNKLYGLNYTLAPEVMFYNKTLFDKAGVKYPDGTWTWDDYVAAAEKLTVKDGNKVTQYGTDGMTSWWLPTEAAIRQNGGDIFKDGKANFDSPEVINAIQFWADVTLKKGIAPTIAEMSGGGDLFPSGMVAMTRNGIWLKDTYKDIKNFEWDIAPLPKNKDANTILHSSYFTIAKKSKHPQETWELIKWLSGPEIQKGVSERLGYVPTRKSVLEQKPYDSGQPAGTAFVGDVVNYGRIGPYAPGVKQITDEFEKQLEQIYTGKLTAEESMKAFQTKAQSIIDLNNK